jgi:AcrR family transcriptional regulator
LTRASALAPLRRRFARNREFAEARRGAPLFGRLTNSERATKEGAMTETKSDKTRARVIEGAIRALCAFGVIGATTRKIAAESDVHLATLHYHFDSKSALLLAVLEALIEEMTRNLRDGVKSSSDLAACIEQVLRASWRWVTRTRELQIVQYELTLYALREGAQWLAERQYDAYVEVYCDFLAMVARETGELSPAGCIAVARFILAGVDGLILQELARPNQARSKRSIEALIRSAQIYARSIEAARADALDRAHS